MKIRDIIQKKQDKIFEFKKYNNKKYFIYYINNKTYQIQFSSFYVENQIQNILEVETNHYISIPIFMNDIIHLEDQEMSEIKIDMNEKDLDYIEQVVKKLNMTISDYTYEAIIEFIYNDQINEKY